MGVSAAVGVVVGECQQRVVVSVRTALDGGTSGGIEPLDWLCTTTPEHWKDATGNLSYDWLDQFGADPFEWAEHNI